MTITVDTRVPYTLPNIQRCMCPQCPVQARDECVREKVNDLPNVVQSSGRGETPDPDKIPGIYCSTGSAKCVNLDPNQQCICKTCAVWAEYGLENTGPMMYFCNIGRAD